MRQLRSPRTPHVGTIGACLAYARGVYGIPAKYQTARIAWNNAQFKHTDPLPDASVPVWFSHISGGVDVGHVVCWVPRVGFFSSPYRRNTGYALLPSISEVERIYGCRYLGWSEDINSVRVAIEEQEDPVRIKELEQQNRDLQAQINTLRPDLVTMTNRLDHALAEIGRLQQTMADERIAFDAEKVIFAKQIEELVNNQNGAIQQAQVTAPSATKKSWFTRLVATLTKSK